MVKAKDKAKKTNALRALDAAKIPYEVTFFESPEALSGTAVADLLGQNPDSVFKTLVTQGKTGAHYVFMVPVALELDLKKAALAVGEKSVAMIPAKELLPLTGYIHGGCSPIGMKTPFPTTIDASAKAYDTIMFSGGRLGCQLSMAPGDLNKIVPLKFEAITTD